MSTALIQFADTSLTTASLRGVAGDNRCDILRDAARLRRHPTDRDDYRLSFICTGCAAMRCIAVRRVAVPCGAAR